MATIKISGLTEQTELKGDDMIPVDNGTRANKVSFANFAKKLNIPNAVLMSSAATVQDPKLVVAYGDHNYLKSTVDASIIETPSTSNFLYFALVNDGKVIAALAIGVDYTSKCYSYANNDVRNSWVEI